MRTHLWPPRRRGLAEGPYRDVRLHRVHEIGAVQQIREGKQIRAAAEIRVPKSRLADARREPLERRVRRRDDHEPPSSLRLRAVPYKANVGVELKGVSWR